MVLEIGDLLYGDVKELGVMDMLYGISCEVWCKEEEDDAKKKMNINLSQIIANRLDKRLFPE